MTDSRVALIAHTAGTDPTGALARAILSFRSFNCTVIPSSGRANPAPANDVSRSQYLLPESVPARDFVRKA